MVDIVKASFEDAATWNMLSSRRTAGVFQVESGQFTDFLEKLKPHHINHLIDSMAIQRPGPLGSGMVDSYIDRLHGKEESTYLHPALEPILKDTFGTIVYQEQCMKIANVLAGYTLAEADTLRKTIGKKLVDLMPKERKKFVDGCVSKSGLDKDVAEKLFDQIETFGSYGFNQSHAASYGILSFHTAWLKANYPLEYMASLLNAQDLEDKLRHYVQECREINVPILPPDINTSKAGFSITSNGEAVFGLSKIKGIGVAAAEIIVSRQPYVSYVDFWEKNFGDIHINSDVIKKLISVGAFRSLKNTIKQLLETFDSIKDIYKQKSVSRKDLVAANILALWNKQNSDSLEYEPVNLCRLEKESIGFYLTNYPLDFIKADPIFKHACYCPISDFNTKSEAVTVCIVASVEKKKSRKGTVYWKILLEDRSGSNETALFADDVAQWGKSFSVGDCVAFGWKRDKYHAQGQLGKMRLKDVRVIMTAKQDKVPKE